MPHLAQPHRFRYVSTNTAATSAMLRPNLLGFEIDVASKRIPVSYTSYMK